MNGKEVYWDGCGTIGGKLISEAQDLNYVDAGDLDVSKSYLECAGSFCLYVRDEAGISIYPDPLGAGLVYKYEDKDIVAYSSDLTALVNKLKKQNLSSLIHFI